MQAKALAYLAPPSPSPNPHNQTADTVVYSFKLQHFIIILIIIYLVFLFCDSIWTQLIEKWSSDPSVTLSSCLPISLRRSHLHVANSGGITTPGPISLTQIRRQLSPPPPRPPLALLPSAGREDCNAGKGAANTCSECVICLKEFRYGDLCRVLPNCYHTFHAPCIDGWIMINQTCPICRSSVQAD